MLNNKTHKQNDATKAENDAIIFRVQIETSEKRVQLTDPKFKGYTVHEYQQDGLYKYTIGHYSNDYNTANAMKNKLRESGFQHAFVVAFLKNERINLQKAIKLAEN